MSDSRPLSCPSCHATWEVAALRWCDCVTKTPSPVCPACAACSCELPYRAKREFWEDAAAPVRSSLAAKRARLQREAKAVLIRPLVLVVDDDPDVSSIAAVLVSSYGYGVLVASSAVDALRLTVRHRPEIVLTDAHMPEMDGRDLCHRIKSTPSLAPTRVIIMTAVFKGPRYHRDSRHLYGADGVVTKPLKADALREVIASNLAVGGM